MTAAQENACRSVVSLIHSHGVSPHIVRSESALLLYVQGRGGRAIFDICDSGEVHIEFFAAADISTASGADIKPVSDALRRVFGA